jgi:hypothetical protein
MSTETYFKFLGRILIDTKKSSTDNEGHTNQQQQQFVLRKFNGKTWQEGQIRIKTSNEG